MHDDCLAATIAPLARGPGGAILRTRSGDQHVLHHWDGARLLVLSDPGSRLPPEQPASLLLELDEGDHAVLEVRGDLRAGEPKQWRLAWLLALVRRHGMGVARRSIAECSLPIGDIAQLEARHAAVTVLETD